MKIQKHCMQSNLTVLLFFSTLLLSGVVHSDEHVKRKSGIWESTINAMGIISSVQECVDHDTDDLVAQTVNYSKGSCSVMNISVQSGKITVHSVCKIGANSGTTDGEISGDFNVAYSGNVSTHIDPPMSGISEMDIQTNSKWIGSCSADRKPGSIIMKLPGNGGTIDLNDPQVKAMIESMKTNQMQQQK